ncbi:MAG: type II toxin-antitoxin system RelE/ParE family toxin [Methylococcales bacterium]|nr:type II toxin-antitoxin system RelE/ParE family toxin [Methylococcales bacterium]
MFKSFTHKGLEKFFTTGNQAGFQAVHAKRLRLILALLNDARQLADLDAPALWLQALKDERNGFRAVTVQANCQWQNRHQP